MSSEDSIAHASSEAESADTAAVSVELSIVDEAHILLKTSDAPKRLAMFARSLIDTGVIVEIPSQDLIVPKNCNANIHKYERNAENTAKKLEKMEAELEESDSKLRKYFLEAFDKLMSRIDAIIAEMEVGTSTHDWENLEREQARTNQAEANTETNQTTSVAIFKETLEHHEPNAEQNEEVREICLF